LVEDLMQVLQLLDLVRLDLVLLLDLVRLHLVQVV
jgi:hypothetical protein